MLDQGSLLSCCEAMAYMESARGRDVEAVTWEDRANRVARAGLDVNTALAELARAHALRRSDASVAAEHARKAARLFAGAEVRIDTGRARLCAGLASADAGDCSLAREELRAAAEIFAGCG